MARSKTGPTRVPELRVPTTLIVGDKDQAIPLDFQRKHTLPLVEKTGGKLVIIEGAAHMLPNEAAAELSIILGELLYSYREKSQ